MDRIWKFSLVMAAIIIADQISKGMIQQNFTLGESIPLLKGFFNFTYVRNTGAAFGMGAGASETMRRIWFLALPVVACIWLVVLIWKQRKENWLLGWAYSLILAGAIGNLIDRFSLGYVVDFLDFYYGTAHFPAFNIADSSITIAGGLLILEFFISQKKEKEAKAS